MRLPIMRGSLVFVTIAVLLFRGAGLARAENKCPVSSAAATLPASLKMKELGEALATRMDACAGDERRADGERFWKKHSLEVTADRQRDYARARTLFEMTRDGGSWRVRWAITNQEPTAKKIWEAWQTKPPVAVTSSVVPSVTAECDEISALFAGLSRRVGVRGIGLFWPTSNHTIAAWEAAPGVRVLIPTTQIYASCDDTFDQTPFKPGVQKTVYEFSASDAPDTMAVSQPLASFLVDQVTHYSGASLEVLSAIRIHRALALGSSVASECRGPLAASAKKLRAAPTTPRDQRALIRYGETELAMTTPTANDVLDRLALIP